MSDDQGQSGGGVEVDLSSSAAGARSASPFDNAPGNALDGASETLPFADFGALSNSRAMVPARPPAPAALTFNSMLDVPIPIVFEVGRTTISIAHLMELREGSFIDLRNVSIDVIDVLIDEKIVAEAEAISLQQRYGVRISEIMRIPSSEDLEDAS
ncbi:MAG: FliM/FliN family flagellar motor switch protein [Pseudohongiellaceae bacterium]